MSTNPYDQRYQAPGYYWGTKPSILCDKILELIPQAERHGKLVVDLGCGEGRNAVYLAEHGFDLWAMDSSETALKKVAQMAGERNVKLQTSLQDINNCTLPQSIDILFSTGTVQYLHPESRATHFITMQNLTNVGGLHAISALVTKPFIPAAPDADASAVLFKSGELLSYYWHWEILYSIEEIFDCNSGGIPHCHAVNRIIAKRPIR